MRKERSDGKDTRQRLLAAAVDVFADKGYWEASNVDICSRAGANSASLNYHFGSKENMYVEAWKYAFARSMDVHPPDGGGRPEAPAADRLAGRIRAFIEHVADPDTRDMDFAHKEMACPTGLLMEAIDEATRPMRDAFDAILREMLGSKASKQQIQYWQMSIMGLCFGTMLHMRHMKKLPDAPRPKGLPVEVDLQAFTKHTINLILAGLKAAKGR